MGNISELFRSKKGIAQQGRPSVGDVGRSLLLSAAYRGAKPHTEFLAEDQARQYQQVGAQTQMLSQLTQVRLHQAEMKAQSNPLAGFFRDSLTQIMQEGPDGPDRANKIVADLEADKRPMTIQTFAEAVAKYPAQTDADDPKFISQDVGDETVSGFLQDGELIPSPLTGELITRGPRYKPETNVTTEVKIPAQYPPAPTGYHYTELPEVGKPIKLEKTEGGPPENSTESGRLAALDIAKQDIALAKKIMMPRGEKSMTASLTGDWNVPFTEGRRAKTAMRRSLDTLAKYKTGAAMNESEAENYLETYMPKPGDSQAEAADKFLRFEQFIEESFKRSGTTPNIGQGPQPGDIEDGYRFKGGNPGDPNNWEKVQ
jgi:hypothetical protein